MNSIFATIALVVMLINFWLAAVEYYESGISKYVIIPLVFGILSFGMFLWILGVIPHLLTWMWVW